MSEPYKPYAKSSSSYNAFNAFYYYTWRFKKQPYVFKLTNLLISDNIVEKLQNKKAEMVFESRTDYRNKKNDKRDVFTTQYYYVYKDAIICLDRAKEDDDDFIAHMGSDNFEEKMKKKSFWTQILYTESETLEEIRSLFEYREETKQGNVYLICQDNIEGTYLKKFDVRLPNSDIDVELNYGKEFAKKYDKILEKLKDTQKSGLVLFSGVPGSGKTTIVKNIAMNIDKKIIFVPPGTVDIITTPGFLNFMLDHKNSILLIEDAEKVIRSREGEGGNPEGVSNILNLTDGVLGDCLNLFIIATFNTPREKIDKALIRKGRLVAEHHFEELTAEQANIILKKIGSKRVAEKSMTLAEIYNEEGGMEEKEKESEKKRIGFSVK